MRIVPLALALAGGIGIAAGGYTAYWFIAAGAIEDRIAVWVEEQRARGVVVEHAGTAVTGFPLYFDIVFSEPRIEDSENGWSWAADRFHARMRPWNYGKVTVFPDRQNAVRIQDGGEWREIDWRIADGQLTVRLDGDWRVRDVALDMEGVEVDGVWDAGTARIQTLSANGFVDQEAEGGEEAGEALRAALALREIDLPSGEGAGLGENLSFLDLDASLIGPVLAADETSAAIAAWRDGGGVVELTDFKVRWGPLGIRSKGTLALDGEMRPIGAFTADIIGYGDVIDALIMSNAIPLGDGFIAKVAFNMMADKPEDGGPPVLREVPVTAQDGTLFVGPVKVAEIPPLDLE